MISYEERYMRGLYDFLTGITPYRGLILTLAVLLIIAMIVVVTVNAIKNLMAQMRAQQEEIREDNLKNVDYDTIEKRKKSAMLKQAIAPDGVDPNPNSYLIINDGGTDVYVRTMTIVSLPRRAKFAVTFSDLLDYPNCTSSVFVKPISEEQMVAKMDRQITVLGAEYLSAEGDPNRQRKLEAQYQDVNDFAAQVESGENKFYQVGFLFTLFADSVKDLNKITSAFRAKALGKNIYVSNCFAVQAEAFAQNAPTNRTMAIESAVIKSDALKWHQMDKKSISAIYNYTQSQFSHKQGIALGRDIMTTAPVLFDIYDGSHDGFTLVIAGKTGSGKSATIKMLACRELLHDYHFVAIDSQARKGLSEGEYAGLAKLADGVNFQISNSSSEIMNIFDVSESVETRPDANNHVHEIRTLELKDKVTMTVNILQTMIRGTAEGKGTDLKNDTYISRILTDNVVAIYKSRGIVDGDPDSLYTEPGSVLAADKGITTGRPAKLLPTLTDFYKQVLISKKANKEDALIEAYNIIIMALADYVTELYYSKDTVHFLTKKQVEQLQYDRSQGARMYINEKQEKEPVIEVKGVRTYYDGQSTFHISKDTTFTNIDISQLPDDEKKLAREIAADFVNENYIKKNSDNINSSDKLVVILDECHEMFASEYARKLLDNIVRTARKRNAAIILSSQTIKEYENYPETQAILKQAAMKFVFKQDYQDRDYLIKALGLTEAQVDYIVNNLGGNSSDDEDKNRHRGEMCIIDNKQVCFCKVDYRKNTEKYAVETDAAAIDRMFSAAG